MAIYKKVPSYPLKGMVEERIYIAKDGNDLRAFTVAGGKVYEISLVAKESAPSSGGSGGTSDHGALSGLTDDDHTQYVLRSIATTKGDLLSYSTEIIRLGIGSDGQLLIPDTPSTPGIKWGNLIFNSDELISNNDEIVTV